MTAKGLDDRRFRWRILPGLVRSGGEVDPRNRVTLIASNDRVRPYGPFVWMVYGPDGQVAKGEIWQPGRYRALVREAMYQAELAAASYLEREANR